ncbi:MAG: bifunctional precorrin-2 dehydrogenase/sirohydrochlorin ferrochelatase [Thermoplasmatota archaeon]|nr:bifunctional precorrin-2 dehydrogenase/sirohydrochlorin ferrochelatase [Candidatus Thermoplasmatota archaeon]MBU1914263.1 bifunctional precorrin-2 dehydrogenase/sirohydrochlorin ferrochelatase [Candidatus Thermoplasmatota archaeon]
MVPLIIDFKDKPVVICGGGNVGLRKAKIFCRAGARVRVLSKEFAKGFDSLPVDKLKVSSINDLRVLDGAFIVIAATDDPDTNSRISRACEQKAIMCNSVDNLESEVYLPSIITRGPLTIGISTKGDSPGLSRMARLRIEKIIGPEWGRMAALQAEVRSRLKSSERTQSSRRKVIHKILDDPDIWKALEAGNMRRARGLAAKRYLGERN